MEKKRWGITDSMDMSLSELRELVMDSHVAPGKSGVHAHGEGERVIALESW